MGTVKRGARAGIGCGNRGPPVAVYLDTSSLLKLHVEEPASDQVRELVRKATVTVTSNVAYAETRAALGRRRRDGTLTAAAFRTAKQDFEAGWPTFVIPASPKVCLEAGNLAEDYALRGFDSIHLASFAEILRGLQGRDDTQFSSSDDKLNAAAHRLARTIR